MSKKAEIVLGLGYGDEGKGLVTNLLSSKASRPIVVRFNGGQQAGHTVYKKDGNHHVFSNFGSGTFNGTPTYWSSYCSFSPVYFIDEYSEVSIKPLMYLDVCAPITTHYDVLYNRACEVSRGVGRYGSCGLGFGATVDRNAYSKIGMKVSDLFDEKTCKIKLNEIREYYRQKIDQETIFSFNEFTHNDEDKTFLRNIDQLRYLKIIGQLHLVNEEELFNLKQFDTYVFEGAQGILLDQNFGVKPYITKSNTTSQNAIEILGRNLIDNISIIYVSRAYHTRHGSGPFHQENYPLDLINNDSETNIFNTYQRYFRTGILDLDLLEKAVSFDMQFSTGINKTLVITCIDQLPNEKIRYLRKGQQLQCDYRDLATKINISFSRIIFSHSKFSEDLTY